jgi:hypothetical protein
MTRTNRVTFAFIAACVFGLAGTTRGAGQYLTVDYPASTVTSELQIAVTYTLWIPDGTPCLRGVIVHQLGAGTTASIEGSTAAHDLHWQALAKKWDCALLGPSYHVLHEKNDLSPGGSELWFDPRRGSEKTFLKALGELASKSGHPELETVPWVLWGHSGGGIWSDVMCALHPDRVVAVWMRSGSAFMFLSHPEFARHTVPNAVYGIPMMCNPGVKEKQVAQEKNTPEQNMKGPWLGNLATFHEYRAKGAPIGFAPDARTGHECGDSRYLAIPFLDACLAMRLPEKDATDQTLKPVDMSKAWLAPLMGDEPRPASELQGDPKEAVWLPNEAVAKAWTEYVRTGAVGDTTTPPPPSNVKVSPKGPKGEEGAEIVWSAEADLESGIRCFIVLRDGQELAQVPKTPVGKYGRPLFQSMTYHDTPASPLPEMRYVDASAKPGAKHNYQVITVNSVGLKSTPSDKAAKQNDPPQQGRASNGDTKAAESAKPNFDKNSPFYFDGSISRQTLENYLDRSITMGYFLVPGKPEGYQFPYRDDDVRMIHNLGAKFIGRALYRWGEESKLGEPAFLEYAKKMVDRVHTADPEVVFQGCLFEQVSTDINKLKIPAWVFADFGLPVEDRTFSSAAIIKREGRPDRGGGRGGVPIINNLETRLWFYYLAVSYINVGCEAFHLGQVGLIGADDKDLKVYSEFLAKVRTYAKLHARRHLVLMDGHVPSGGMVKDGVSLLDFNSFPMRIKAVPGKPHEGILEVGHLDALFKRSKGCISPSGWKCDSLPYLVEFDNFGRGPNPNVADPKSMFCWGWDEISWFAQQPEEYRNQWLHYAHDWIQQTDPNGHLEMPGTRMITCPNETLRTYFANTKGPACPVGYSQEETIRKIWNQGQSPRKAVSFAEPIRQ